MVDKYLSWKSKLFSVILGGLFLLQILLVLNCAADCFYIYGDMSADLESEQTFSYQISGTVSTFKYRHYHPSEYNYITNIQENTSSSIAFSYNPATQNTDVDQFGNTYTDYTWNNLSNPPDLDITKIQSATTSAQLDPFSSSDPFPVNQGSIPADVQTYQQSTSLVQADDAGIQTQADAEVQGCTHQYQAVENIIKWIMDAVEYDSSVSSTNSDATYTFNEGKGVCMGFSHLACAMLRAVNIPARYVSGISFDRSYNYSYGSYTYSTSWNDGPHAWIEVYYPELGCWIPYDAQRDIHHIDVFRMKKGHGLDNKSFSTISYTYFSPPSITAAAPILNLTMQNDVVNIGVSNKTSDVTETALSVEITAGASSSLSPPLLDPLTTPTYEKNITITGTAEAGSTVEIFLNNNSVGTTVAAQNGNFSLAATLANGTNEIKAQASLGGDVSNLSQTKYVILKTQSQGSGSSSGLYGGGLYGSGLFGGLYGGGFGGGLFGGSYGGNLFGGSFGGGLYGGSFGGGLFGNSFGGSFGGGLYGGSSFGGGLFGSSFGGGLFGNSFGGGLFAGSYGGNLFGNSFGGGLFGGSSFGGSSFGGLFGGGLFGNSFGGYGGGLFGGFYSSGFPF